LKSTEKLLRGRLTDESTSSLLHPYALRGLDPDPFRWRADYTSARASRCASSSARRSASVSAEKP
jgi:hypothetical protein